MAQMSAIETMGSVQVNQELKYRAPTLAERESVHRIEHILSEGERTTCRLLGSDDASNCEL